MGGGLSVRNDTGIEVIVELSQTGPLTWERIAPYSTKEISCGQVWFTVTARLWDGSEPSGWDVAKPFVIGFSGAVAVVGGGVAAAGLAAVRTAAVAGGSAAAQAGTTAAVVGGVSTVAGSAIGVGAALSSNAHCSSQNAVSEDTKKWLAHTPSERSAEWLAKHQVICVEPVSDRGVYADGKRITVSHSFTSSDGGRRMTLTLSGT